MISIIKGELIQSLLAQFVMATVHPSSILRAPDERARREEMRRFIDDLKKGRARPLRSGVKDPCKTCTGVPLWAPLLASSSFCVCGRGAHRGTPVQVLARSRGGSHSSPERFDGFDNFLAVAVCFDLGPHFGDLPLFVDDVSDSRDPPILLAVHALFLPCAVLLR